MLSYLSRCIFRVIIMRATVSGLRITSSSATLLRLTLIVNMMQTVLAMTNAADTSINNDDDDGETDSDSIVYVG